MLIVILNFEVSVEGIVIERFQQTLFHKQASLPIRMLFDTSARNNSAHIADHHDRLDKNSGDH